jgi:hypothetical protein
VLEASNEPGLLKVGGTEEMETAGVVAGEEGKLETGDMEIAELVDDTRGLGTLVDAELASKLLPKEEVLDETTEEGKLLEDGRELAVLGGEEVAVDGEEFGVLEGLTEGDEDTILVEAIEDGRPLKDGEVELTLLRREDGALNREEDTVADALEMDAEGNENPDVLTGDDDDGVAVMLRDPD